MEPNNTPSRLRNITAPLLRVTPLSRALAMLVFIALPFLGGYVGYRSAPQKTVYIESSTETNVETDDGWGEVIKQYQSAYNTDRVLEFLFRASSDMEIVYFKSIGQTSACCGVIGYNQRTNSFFETEAYADAVSGDIFSPSGDLIARFNNHDTQLPSLLIYDIEEANAVIKTITLDPPESLKASKCGYGGAYANLTWLDNETISYGVYKEVSKDPQSCDMEFIEYRYEKVR